MECPNCDHKYSDKEIISEAARINGERKSGKKAESSRKNGQLGGRPPKRKD